MHAVPELVSPSNVPAAHTVHVDVVSVNDPTAQSVHSSTTVDDVEASALKVPEAHAVHTGSAMLEPTVAVYLPARQSV